MLNRDWPGWHLIAVICLAITGASAMITPGSLGVSQITVNWIILLSSILGTVSASMGSSGLPGQKEINAMTVGKAVIAPTVENKAAAVAVIDALPVVTCPEVKP